MGPFEAIICYNNHQLGAVKKTMSARYDGMVEYAEWTTFDASMRAYLRVCAFVAETCSVCILINHMLASAIIGSGKGSATIEECDAMLNIKIIDSCVFLNDCFIYLMAEHSHCNALDVKACEDTVKCIDNLLTEAKKMVAAAERNKQYMNGFNADVLDTVVYAAAFVKSECALVRRESAYESGPLKVACSTNASVARASGGSAKQARNKNAGKGSKNRRG